MRGVIFPVSYILNNCDDAIMAFPNDISKFHKALHLKWWQHFFNAIILFWHKLQRSKKLSRKNCTLWQPWKKNKFKCTFMSLTLHCFKTVNYIPCNNIGLTWYFLNKAFLVRCSCTTCFIPHSIYIDLTKKKLMVYGISGIFMD